MNNTLELSKCSEDYTKLLILCMDVDMENGATSKEAWAAARGWLKKTKGIDIPDYREDLWK